MKSRSKEYRYWIKKKTNKTFVDLFCGAGGLSLGFLRSGFKCELAVDYEKSCIETFKHNHPNVENKNILLDDVRKLNLSNWKGYKYLKNKIDVLCGGPPCQGFSTANRQRLINDPRNALYKEFVDAVKFFHPKIILMENVLGIFNLREQIINDFKKIGYDGICFKLNAQDFGIPQRRKRAFFIMFCKKKTSITKSVFEKKIMHYIEKEKKKNKTTIKEAIFDLKPLKPKNIKNNTLLENESFGYFKQPNKQKPSKYVEEINGIKGANPYIYNHKSRYNNDRDIKIYSLLKQGGNSESKEIEPLNPYKRRGKIFKDKFYKLKETDVSKTITAHMKFDCHMYIHPTQPRGLTPREAARIQSYPDSYVFKGPFTKWYMQIGNSVPPLLSHVLANSIKQLLDETN